MGAYYGGDIYTNAIAQIGAVSATEDLKQIGAAATLYFTDNGSTLHFPGGNYQTVISTYLVPTYLSQLPSNSIYDMANAPFRLYAIDRASSGFSVGVTYANTNTVGIKLPGVDDRTIQICKKFVESKGSSGSYAYNMTFPSFSNTQTKSWYCGFTDNNNNNIPDAGDTDFFLFYIFG